MEPINIALSKESIEKTSSLSLVNKAVGLAEKLSLGSIALEAQRAWQLAKESRPEGFLTQISALPLAAAVIAEQNIATTPIGKKLEILPDLFPNPIGWKTILGGAIGAVCGFAAGGIAGIFAGTLSSATLGGFKMEIKHKNTTETISYRGPLTALLPPEQQNPLVGSYYAYGLGCGFTLGAGSTIGSLIGAHIGNKMEVA